MDSSRSFLLVNYRTVPEVAATERCFLVAFGLAATFQTESTILCVSARQGSDQRKPLASLRHEHEGAGKAIALIFLARFAADCVCIVV